MKNLFFKTLFVIFLFQLAHASNFGQNKVQYLSSDWRRIQTEHFDIFFNQEGDSVAAFSADKVEAIYKDLSHKLNHKLYRRVPILLHNSPNHFQETNVIRIPLPEAVGGFTEILKNRIVLPFAGDWFEFAHVIKHEMVHAMVFDLMRGPDGGAMNIAQRMTHIPLWFNEGLAEWASNEWNIDGEFFLIDAVTNGYVPPPTYEMPGYLAYKGGHSFLMFLSDNFGDKVIYKLLDDLAKGFSLDNAFLRNTKISLEELGELWIRELRRLYWPELGQRQYAKRISTPMIDHEKTSSFLNATPSLSPNGEYLAYASDGGNWEGIFLQKIKDQSTTQILKNGFISDHESLHLLSSGFDWSPDSKTLVFISQNHGKDVLSLYDINKEKVTIQIATPYHTLRNPSYSPDGSKIIFSAQSPIGSYIAYYDFSNKKIEQITNDNHLNLHPSFSRDSKKIVFSSDEFRDPADSLNPKKLDLILMDLESKKTERLTYSRWNSESAIFDSKNTGLYFLSDISGVKNIYHLNLKTQEIKAITNVLSSIESMSYNPRQEQIAYSLFEKGGWNLFLIDSLNLDDYDNSPLPETYFIKWAKQSKEPYFRNIKKEVLSSFKQSHLDSLARDSVKNSDSTWVKEDSLRRVDSLDFASAIYADTINEFNIKNNKDSISGDYKIEEYQTDWSLDQASVLAGVSAGSSANVNFGGQALLTFSDLTGDHELSFELLAQGVSFDDINIRSAYSYLKHQIDFSFYAFHEVNLVSEYISTDYNGNYIRGDQWADKIEVFDQYEYHYDSLSNTIDTLNYQVCLFEEGDFAELILADNKKQRCNKYDYFKDRQIGFGALISYPTSRFNRFDISTDFIRITREKYRFNSNDELVVNADLKSKQLNFVHSALSWSFDNSRWGNVGPVNGGRYTASLETRIPLEDQEPYWLSHFDFRNYLRFFKRFTLANRLFAGASGSYGSEESPHRFLLGGDQPFTFNGHVNISNLDGTLPSRYNSDLTTPLRGFKYYDFAGRYTALWNLEFRFPFIYQLAFQLPVPFPAPVVISNVQGIIFSDLGSAWSHDEIFSQMGQGMGWGLQMNLGYLILRYTRAYTNSAFDRYRAGATQYWSLGAQF